MGELKLKKYDLTNPQKSIWVTEEFYKRTSIENIGGSTIIHDIVDFEKLKKAINIFVKNNDSLRLKFVNENNIIKQYVADFNELSFDVAEIKSDKDLRKIEKEYANTPFDIFNSFLFKLQLYKYSDGHGGFVIVVHHLIADAWGAGLIISEILNTYNALLQNKEYINQTHSYLEYIEAEQEYLSSKKFEKDKAFWTEEFNLVPEAATIPGSINSKEISSNAKRKQFKIPAETMDLINIYCKDNKISPFNFFMGVYSLYLSRVSGLDEFVIGTPLLNRANVKEKHTIGMFISVVPFKVNINQEKSFTEFASQISSNFFNIFRHQKYPYQFLLEDLRKQNSSTPNLYNIMLSYQNMRTDTKNSKTNYETTWLFNGNVSDDLEIHFFDINDSGIINVAYDYKTSKYTADDMYALHSRLLHIMNQILDNNNILLKDIEIVTPDEKNEILYKFNNTKMDYPKNKTIVQLFEEQVEKTPNNVAVVFENQKLTYKELNEKANNLANYIKKVCPGSQNVIGIHLEKSINYIVSILATLKTGNIFLPISTLHPKDRIEYILQDSKAKVLISNNILTNDLNFSCQYIDINNLTFIPANKAINSVGTSDNIAYILYTSGSTGNPKGVKIKNYSLVNHVFAINKKFSNKISKSDKCLSIANISFDANIQEIFIPLLLGATLHMLPDENIYNIKLLAEYISSRNITFAFIPPNILDDVYDFLRNDEHIKLNKLLVGVEKISFNTLNKYLSLTPNMQIHNGYGPTEATICCISYMYSNNNKTAQSTYVPIGSPLANNKVIIVEPTSKRIQPMSVPGEIIVLGDQVSDGYTNNKLNTPFYLCKYFNQKAYCTGDFGYYTADGNIIFVGRKDNQVKLNGHRIELLEIDNVLQGFEGITRSVTIIKNNQIVSFFVSPQEIIIDNLKNYVKNKLPNYMVPYKFIQIEKMPITKNGKIDKNKLLTVNINNNKNIIAPSNDVELKLFKIYSALLSINEFSITDSFFDLGGDSLAAIRLSVEIGKTFSKDLSVQDIFNYPSIKDLSSYIEILSQSSNTDIPKIPQASFYPTSSAQKRIYFASSIAGEQNVLYNIPGGIILDGEIDYKKLEECFKTLINRHESLRTYFELKDNNVVQKIAKDISFKLEVIKNQKNDDLNSIFVDFVKPFDLSKAPLFRAKLICFTNKTQALLVDMHHIISDGTSMSILIDELCKLYNNEVLPELNITYKDFASFERKRLNLGDLKEAEEYWVNQFKDEIPVLNLPTKTARPAVQTFDGKKIYSSINMETANKIEQLAKDLGITPYMVMLGAYYILLSKYTSGDDIVVGTPVVGRDIADTYNIIGMFVNTLAIREKVESKLTFKEFLSSLKQNLLNSYKYQAYPFDELVNKLDIKRDTSRNPLFDTMFTYQNNGYTPLHFNGISSEYYVPDAGISKFDLSLEVIPNETGAQISFEYASKLFDEEFIKAMSNHYLNILDTILENIEIKISDIDMLSPEEKNRILFDFNNTKMDYPKDKTIIQLFEEQVEKTPDNVAVVFEDKKLTYRELNEKANSLAHYLKHSYVKKGDNVPILMNRSIELMISMLASIKCGGVYLPISPETPVERINYILQNSNANIVITKPTQTLVSNTNIKTINIEEFDYTKYSYKNLCLEIKPTDLLYTIYTSGSTGDPKGVKVCHKNLINFVYSFNKLYGNITSTDKLLASTSISFDVSIFELFMPLLNGSSLYLYDEPSINDIFKYCKAITKNKITFAYIPPNILEEVYNILSNYSYISLNKLLLGVEPIKSSIIKKYYSLNPNLKIINAYGPTETTICATGILLDENILKDYKIIPIGKPLFNLNVFILDRNMQPVPTGVPGEIYISGDNVSKGYLNNKELTEKLFVSIPHLNCNLAYKTGDFAKWDYNGIINFLGRNDSQIKVNGHRIELGEIENCIYLYPNIDKVIVLLEKNNKLVCYFSSSKQINISDLKAFIQRKLPLYFIPNFFVQVQNFKLTSNGKIDKKYLQKIKLDIENIYEAPQTDFQKSLVSAFEAVLGRTNIGITDNFFDLGGDSLLAIKLQIEAFNKGLDLPYQNIFKYPTIKQLSENISSVKGNDFDDGYDYTEINEFLKNNSFDKKDKLLKNKFKNILLMGSTGYMGSHILDALLKNTRCNIYCLIRAKDNNDPQIRLLNTLRFYFGNKYDREIFNRIIVIEGDVKEDKLGLNDLYYDELGANIDCVINSAAIVKHYGNSNAFNSTNIQGAKNIINFCSNFNCRLYHLSTLSVSGNIFETNIYKVANLSNDIVFNEQKLYIGQDLSNVYIYTKFIAERLIIENIINGKLDAKIIRLGNITNRYSDGIFQINVSENAFINRINSFLHIGYIPDYLLDRYIEFSPVDFCAEAITKLVFYNSNSCIYHVYNNNHITFKELSDILNNLNISSVIVDKETFNKKIKSLSKDVSTKNILSGIINDFDENKNLSYNSNIKIQNSLTNNILKSLSFRWPKINEKYLRKYIIYLKTIGYIK